MRVMLYITSASFITGFFVTLRDGFHPAIALMMLVAASIFVHEYKQRNVP